MASSDTSKSERGDTKRHPSYIRKWSVTTTYQEYANSIITNSLYERGLKVVVNPYKYLHYAWSQHPFDQSNTLGSAPLDITGKKMFDTF